MRVCRGCRIAAGVLFSSLSVGSISAAQSTEDRLPGRPIPLELIQLVPEPRVVVVSEPQIREVFERVLRERKAAKKGRGN